LPVDPQQLPLSGIPIGIFLMFLGSLLGLLPLYDLGFLIFLGSLALVFVQWIASGGIAEILNWLPIILILVIILTLSSDFVSQSSETQVYTWPLILLVLVVIVGFMLAQGGDVSFIMPFLPFLLGIGIIGVVGGELLWQDAFRGLAYSIGFLGIVIVLIWLRVRKTQRMAPIVGDKEHMIGKTGLTLSFISPDVEGRVRVAGATWKAQSELKILENEIIRVVGIEGLVLKVEPNQGST
jgi:membrane protein implicated in regulation of membrane protease activity